MISLVMDSNPVVWRLRLDPPSGAHGAQGVFKVAGMIPKISTKARKLAGGPSTLL